MIKGLAHITGGGLIDNIPRILPENCAVEITKGSWPILSIYTLLQQIGNVSEFEMYRTFNMGVGMVIVSSQQDANVIKSHLAGTAYEIGRGVGGNSQVTNR